MSSTGNPILCPLACSHPPFASVEAASKHVRRRLCPKAGSLLSQDIEAAIKKNKKERKKTTSVSCRLCGLLVSNNGELRDHSRMHQEAQFVCRYCGRAFNRQDHQREHEAQVCNPSRGDSSKYDRTLGKGFLSAEEIVAGSTGKRVRQTEQKEDDDVEPAHKEFLSSPVPLPSVESSGFAEAIEARGSMRDHAPVSLSPTAFVQCLASTISNDLATASEVKQEDSHSTCDQHPVLTPAGKSGDNQAMTGSAGGKDREHPTPADEPVNEIIRSPDRLPEPAKVGDEKLASLEDKEKSQDTEGAPCTPVVKMKAQTLHNRFRYNSRMNEAEGRALSFVVIMTSCLPSRRKLMLNGEEEEAQGKKDIVIGPATHWTYYARLKVTDGSTYQPLKLWFFSTSFDHIPPALGADKVVVLGIDNVRCTKKRGVRYLSANDSSSWALFSLAGEIMCAYHWCVPKAFDVYLKPMLEWAQADASCYASKSELFYYKSPEAAPLNTELDPESEREKYMYSVSSMNDDQTLALATLVRNGSIGSGSVAFIDGPAGTGKTYLIKTFLSYLHSKKIKVAVVASTGMAASLYDEGQTAHSAFGIPFYPDENSVCNIRKGTARAVKLENTKVIIWDEAVSAERYALEAVEKGLTRFFCKANEEMRLFGGLVVVFSGDFRQILPITKGSNITPNTIKDTYFWKQVEILRLRRNMRAGEQKGYAEFLIAVGEGARKLVEVPAQCNCSTLDNLVDATFPEFEDKFRDDEYAAKRAILTPTNDAANKINSLMLERIPGNKVQYDWENTDSTRHKIELIQQRLCLKPGCPIMLLVNIGFGLCNGTRMICEQLTKNRIAARVISGSLKGSVIDITRIQSEDKLQFPVVPCFAVTINKAQGQTFDQVGVYLPTPVFAHGQLYVALSRVRSFDRIKIYSRYPKMNNVVDCNILT